MMTMKTDSQLWQTAIHEAGHAVAWLAHGVPVQSISLTADMHEGGSCTPGRIARHNTIETCRVGILIAYAGPVAERRVNPDAKIAGLDLEHATADARRIHGLTAAQSVIDAELARGEAEAERLVETYWTAIENIARQTITLQRHFDSVSPLARQDALRS